MQAVDDILRRLERKRLGQFETGVETAQQAAGDSVTDEDHIPAQRRSIAQNRAEPRHRRSGAFAARRVQFPLAWRVGLADSRPSGGDFGPGHPLPRPERDLAKPVIDAQFRRRQALCHDPRRFHRARQRAGPDGRRTHMRGKQSPAGPRLLSPAVGQRRIQLPLIATLKIELGLPVTKKVDQRSHFP